MIELENLYGMVDENTPKDDYRERPAEDAEKLVAAKAELEERKVHNRNILIRMEELEREKEEWRLKYVELEQIPLRQEHKEQSQDTSFLLEQIAALKAELVNRKELFKLSLKEIGDHNLGNYGIARMKFFGYRILVMKSVKNRTMTNESNKNIE